MALAFVLSFSGTASATMLAHSENSTPSAPKAKTAPTLCAVLNASQCNVFNKASVDFDTNSWGWSSSDGATLLGLLIVAIIGLPIYGPALGLGFGMAAEM